MVNPMNDPPTGQEQAELDRQFEPWRIVVCGSRTWAGSWKPGSSAGSARESLEASMLLGVLNQLRTNAMVGLAGSKDGHHLAIVHGGFLPESNGIGIAMPHGLPIQFPDQAERLPLS